MKRIFGALGDVKSMFFQGFKVGFIVGGVFGGLMGTYYSIMYRSLIYIPMAAIGSGSSFGFFMGIGAVMRAEMEGNEDMERFMNGEKGEKQMNSNDRSEIGLVKEINPFNGQVIYNPMYKPFLL